MAAKRAKRWELANELKELQEWLREPGQEDFQWKEARKHIEEELANPDEKSLAGCQGSLNQLRWWMASRGAVDVLGGRRTGWEHIAKGLAYEMWNLRISLAYYVDRTFPKTGAMCDDDFSVIFSHAIAFRRDQFVHWCGRILVDSFMTGKGAFRDWTITPLNPFVVKLYAKWQSIDLSTAKVKRKLGVYEGLLKHWDDLPNLKKALAEVCDYHCAKVVSDDDDPNEFDGAPYEVFPAEILAYQRIRRDMGVETPSIDHPLLASPLAFPPDKVPVPKDDKLLVKIADLAAQYLPSIGAVESLM